MAAPLRIPRFRLIWTASVLSNLGLLIQGVGAAWAMTESTGDATLVAMVQSATLLPMLLFTLPAGAMADMYPRRVVALVSVFISAMAPAGSVNNSMVARPMENMRPVAALMLLRLAGKERASARLWSFAQGWARQRGIAQRREDISLAG